MTYREWCDNYLTWAEWEAEDALLDYVTRHGADVDKDQFPVEVISNYYAFGHWPKP